MNKEQQKFMDDLLKLDSAVVLSAESDVYAKGIESPSPSLNYIFDNTWLLPDGFSLLLGGEPKGGKSLLVSAMIGMMHKADPDAVALYFDTEFRSRAQKTTSQLKVWGIDPARLRIFETNTPEGVFDQIEQLVPKMVQMGIKVRLVVIDSITDILGRRSINSDTVSQMQIGDSALTLGDGTKRIKSVLRKNGVSLILTTQIRAEMNMLEKQRGHETKLAAPFSVKHSCEYFISVERLATKAGRTDLAGNEFKDDTAVDMTGQNKSEGDEAGHKVRCKMLDSSLGRPGRIAVFTMSHDQGIINTHEEIYLLGKGFKVLETGGAGMHSIANLAILDDRLKPYVDKQWRGREAMLEAIRDNSDLYEGILNTCKRIDIDRKNGIVNSSETKVST